MSQTETPSRPLYTPVLKSTGVRLRIENPIFEEGFNHSRGVRYKGILADPKTGKRYKITGKSCGAPHCQCDAWAEEIIEQHRRIPTVDALIALLSEHPNEPIDCFINLGGVRSSKSIQLSPSGKSFYVLNEVDDTRQTLTQKSLYTRSNIGAAMDRGNFYAY